MVVVEVGFLLQCFFCFFPWVAADSCLLFPFSSRCPCQRECQGPRDESPEAKELSSSSVVNRE